MSASMRPTRAPLRAKATARLTETVDFPTPPLPLETAMTCPRLGYATGVGADGRGRAAGFCSKTGSGRRSLSMCVHLLAGRRLGAHLPDLRDAQLKVCLDALHQGGERHVAVGAAAVQAKHGQPALCIKRNEVDRVRI